MLNKCKNATHPSRSTRKATKSGQVPHVDTAGPSNVTSKGGSKYFILCKDEASNYRQVAFVQGKDEVAAKVKQFISQTVLDTGNDVLKLVSDNGSEYVNQDLSSFLKSKGIMHETSVPYVPAQNGFIERDMRTIKEAAKKCLTRLNSTKYGGQKLSIRPVMSLIE